MVKPFGNILVPYDNSLNAKRALSKAFTLAELTDASITLVHVISYHKAMTKIVEPYKESIINHVKNFFNEAERDASKRNIILKEQILYGNPAEEILNFMKTAKAKCTRNNVEFLDVIDYGGEGRTIVSFAHKNNFDLIVIGSRGMGSVQ